MFIDRGSGGRRAFLGWLIGGGTRKSKRSYIFFFQAEDGIRDYKVTGVQTCALPISVRKLSSTTPRNHASTNHRIPAAWLAGVSGFGALGRAVADTPCTGFTALAEEIGRASCRERV